MEGIDNTYVCFDMYRKFSRQRSRNDNVSSGMDGTGIGLLAQFKGGEATVASTEQK
jgi:hypothetical protein